MYKHILIATDGSELATIGLKHGLALAAALKSKVTIVTVSEPWPAYVIAEDGMWASGDALEQYDKAAAASARRILDAAEAIAKTREVPVNRMHVENSPPAPGIIAAAVQEACDLIVMASHGRRGLGRLVLGSQALEVLTATKIPVLIVR
jgi:nucleotide-binding universal stress UspA family protein